MLLESLQSIILEVAKCHGFEAVLRQIVQGLAAQPNVALARLWLLGPDPEDPRAPECLNLAASAGNPRNPDEDWSRIDGHFRRMRIAGDFKVGQVARTGQPVRIEPIGPGTPWIARPDWAAREGIVGFGGQPLISGGQTLGVLAVFCRRGWTNEEFGWLRAFADHAAVAITNARNLDEIEKLRRQLELECAYLQEEVRSTLACHLMVGESPGIQKIVQQVKLVGPTEANVLIWGESGTGKELVARAIHENSARKSRPLIKVNCSSIPRELFESEFFGHVRGSFTGAIKDRVGRFQLADHGTIFLDEVGEIPLELQSKLLRVLQEGEFEPVGDDRTRRVSVRVVAATNRDLRQEVEAGRFRLDLYYRLSVFPIEVPPLRERSGDIPLLVANFLQLQRQRGAGQVEVKRRQMEQLMAYPWPGNVRELQSVIERGVILARNGVLHLDELITPPQGQAPSAPPALTDEILTEAGMRDWERRNLIAALEKSGWKIYGEGGAAALLAMKPTTLASRIKALQITRPR